MRSTLYILLPALVYGKIAIFVNMTTDSPIIDVHGHTSNLITEEERNDFKIGDVQLKQAVANYSKQTPKDVFVRHNTTYGNLHEKYGWFEVNRIVKAKVKDVGKKDCIVKDWHVRKGLIEEASRYDGDAVFVAENISFKIVHDFGTFEFDSVWGKYETKRDKFPVTFAPVKQTRCEIVAVVEYEAKLSGDIVVNYNQKRGGHYFWAYDIVKVQDMGGLPKTVVREERITIRYGKPMQSTPEVPPSS